MAKHDPAQPLSRYDRRRTELYLERFPTGSPEHDAWMLLPGNDDQLAADPIATLELVRRLRERADEAERVAIEVARRDGGGISWAALGATHGLTRQGAFNRWRKLAGE